MARVVYTALLVLLSPALLWRMWAHTRDGEEPMRLREVVGLGGRPPRADIWVHAASVGEVLAAEPLIRALNPERHGILVTTTTATGAALLRRRFGEAVSHRYLPLDLPWLQRRFQRAVAPRALVIMETELWPNLLARAAADGLAVFLANARLSQRSAARYARFPALVRPALRTLTHIACRDERDRERFLALGAAPEAVVVNGNIKFDIDVDDTDHEAVAGLRVASGGRPVILLASTHADEEAQLLPGLVRLRERVPELLVVLAPRHPDRVPEVSALLREGGEPFALRTTGAPGPEDHWWLVDTLGELKRFYGLADVAFIGGSLVPVGGHNPLEGIVWGCPLVTGPHVHNFEDMMALLRDANLLRQTDDAGSVLEALAMALEWSPRERGGYRDRCRQFMQRHQGATARLASQIEMWFTT